MYQLESQSRVPTREPTRSLRGVTLLKKGMPPTNNAEIQVKQTLKHAANEFNS